LGGGEAGGNTEIEKKKKKKKRTRTRAKKKIQYTTVLTEKNSCKTKNPHFHHFTNDLSLNHIDDKIVEQHTSFKSHYRCDELLSSRLGVFLMSLVSCVNINRAGEINYFNKRIDDNCRDPSIGGVGVT